MNRKVGKYLRRNEKKRNRNCRDQNAAGGQVRFTKPRCCDRGSVIADGWLRCSSRILFRSPTEKVKSQCFHRSGS